MEPSQQPSLTTSPSKGAVSGWAADAVGRDNDNAASFCVTSVVKRLLVVTFWCRSFPNVLIKHRLYSLPD